MGNISKLKREKMLNFLQRLKEQNKTDDESLVAIGEIESALKSQKYGLVWEEHTETVDDNIRGNIPVFTEIKEKTISNVRGGGYNFLLEGDNLHSLYLLKKTHKEKIDVIYIDPPYNTGNKDFIYNDSIIVSDDGYRHSKWLSFMQNRLRLACELLSSEGIIFISIDDNELCNLKLLCDEIFGEYNFIANCFVLDNLKGKANDNFISSVGSRLLVYAKDKRKSSKKGFNDIENIYGIKFENKYIKEDKFGFYNLITFKKTGQSKYREDRPYMFYPILEKNGTLYAIDTDEFEQIYNRETRKFNDAFIDSLRTKYNDFNLILPIDSNGEYLRWTNGFQTFVKKKNLDIVYDDGIKQKIRPEATEFLQVYALGTPKTLMYKGSYSIGTEDLKNVLGINNFNFPKPLELMLDILRLVPNKNAIVLDFFAGSGTTGHAVMQLNKEDGGSRRYILCTNNENNICEEVTYQRLKKIQKDLPHNLKYYRTDLVSRDEEFLAEKLLNHIYEMIQLENGIQIDGKNYIVLLSDADADRLEREWDAAIIPKIIYISRDVLLSTEQEKLFSEVEKQEIPDYYFDFELREVGDLW